MTIKSLLDPAKEGLGGSAGPLQNGTLSYEREQEPIKNLAELSHDIKNVLEVILFSTEMLLEGVIENDSAATRVVLDRIRHNTLRLHSLIVSSLELAGGRAEGETKARYV